MKIMLIVLLLTLGAAPISSGATPECKNPGEKCSSDSDCCYKNKCVSGTCKDGDPRPSGPEWCE